VVVAQDDDSPEAAFAIQPPLAWNRTDRYQPPDFNNFFPDDVEAGKQLDRLLQGELPDLSVEDRLTLIRRGLRNTSHYRTTLLGSVGNQLIWKAEPQDPRAIELMYHASAAPDAEVAHYALYHGPTVVTQRTPNLVRMLMERYQSLDEQMQERIAWGMKTYGDQEHTRRLLLDLLDNHETLDAATLGAAVDTHERIFDELPPNMERFDRIGKWVIAFHRADLSADHPRAAEILRESIEPVFRNRPERLIEFITRVDGKYETGVALVEGMGPRTDLTTYLSKRVHYHIDRNEMLSPRTLQECRLHDFAAHLPDGLPRHAPPVYTRPPSDANYAFNSGEFIAPSFAEYFADDPEAGARLDQVYQSRDSLELEDRELLDLFRRGVRRSTHSPNAMFGWISGALGWPPDPRLTEILYQATDPEAPLDVRSAAIYFGFGLGTEKTRNILEAMYRVYMAPPFDRGTNSNMRGRILWGVRDHEDDKHYLAGRFEQALQGHADLSVEAIRQADAAYRELTGRAPPNAAEYGARGVYLAIAQNERGRSIEESKQRIEERLGRSPQLLDSKYVDDDGRVTALLLVSGPADMQQVIEKLQAEKGLRILFADLLTAELIDQADGGILRNFRKHLAQ
jgi:hypothetical protein